MKRYSRFAALTLIFLIETGCTLGASELTITDRQYLGQEPPGLTPVVFAPGMVSTDGWEIGGTFSPDLKEYYFIREVDVDTEPRQEFVVVQYRDHQWYDRVVSPRVGQPFISPDGNVMYLGRRFRERTEAGWSEIRDLGPPFGDLPIMRLTVSSKGTAFFDEPGMPDGDGVIRFSRSIDGEYEVPRPLSKAINTGSFNAHPFIAPDESYIIWDGRRDEGFGSSDLYISFRKPDGSWDAAINLGKEINTEAWEAVASVTPDGKYLFFNRNIGSENFENVDIFWVSTKFIDDLRPSHGSHEQ